MKTEYYTQLKKNDFVIHKQYGLCIIDKIQMDIFHKKIVGLIIKPLSLKGIILLAGQSGVLFNTFIETKKRLIIGKVENPIIPKLIFKNDKNMYKVHKWDKLGQVAINGKISTKRIAKFPSLKEAQNYIYTLIFNGEVV